MHLLFYFSVSTGIDTAFPILDFQPIVNQQLTLTSTIPVCFNVTILQDITVEGNETFSVVLATLNPRVQIPDRTSLVVIVDDGNYSYICSAISKYLLDICNDCVIKKSEFSFY